MLARQRVCDAVAAACRPIRITLAAIGVELVRLEHRSLRGSASSASASLNALLTRVHPAGLVPSGSK
jgi:hypothetical protein